MVAHRPVPVRDAHHHTLAESTTLFASDGEPLADVSAAAGTDCDESQPPSVAPIRFV